MSAGIQVVERLSAIPRPGYPRSPRASGCSWTVADRHIEGMPHLPIAPSKWDTRGSPTRPMTPIPSLELLVTKDG